MNKAERINEEREENLRIYTEYKAKLYEEYLGRYVVIAKGKIQAVGESFDDVKNVALDANHRFVFKVESKEKVRGRLRWPMKTLSLKKESVTKEIIDMLRNNLVKNGDPQKGIIRTEEWNRRRVHFIS